MASGSFFGAGSSATEAAVTQIMAAGGTITGFRCYQSTAAGANRTYTLTKATISGATVNVRKHDLDVHDRLREPFRHENELRVTVTYNAGDTPDIQSAVTMSVLPPISLPCRRKLPTGPSEPVYRQHLLPAYGRRSTRHESNVGTSI